MEKIDKVLEELQAFKINQAVTHERVKEIKKDLEHGEVSFEKIRTELSDVNDRIDFHDKVVGGVVIAMTILGTLVKFKLL